MACGPWISYRFPAAAPFLDSRQRTQTANGDLTQRCSADSGFECGRWCFAVDAPCDGATQTNRATTSDAMQVARMTRTSSEDDGAAVGRTHGGRCRATTSGSGQRARVSPRGGRLEPELVHRTTDHWMSAFAAAAKNATRPPANATTDKPARMRARRPLTLPVPATGAEGLVAELDCWRTARPPRGRPRSARTTRHGSGDGSGRRGETARSRRAHA